MFLVGLVVVLSLAVVYLLMRRSGSSQLKDISLMSADEKADLITQTKNVLRLKNDQILDLVSVAYKTKIPVGDAGLIDSYTSIVKKALQVADEQVDRLLKNLTVDILQKGCKQVLNPEMIKSFDSHVSNFSKVLLGNPEISDNDSTHSSSGLYQVYPKATHADIDLIIKFIKDGLARVYGMVGLYCQRVNKGEGQVLLNELLADIQMFYQSLKNTSIIMTCEVLEYVLIKAAGKSPKDFL